MAFPKPKPFYVSKTFWINAFALLGAVLSALSGELQASGALSIMAVANIILRTVTNGPMKWK